MSKDDYFFNFKKYRFALTNFEFWLKRCLALDELWVDAFNLGNDELLTVVEQQLVNARAHLEREKRNLIVWIRQAPDGRKNS
jgi:hypothetical protein